MTKGNEAALLKILTHEQKEPSPAEICGKSLLSRGAANTKVLGWEQAWRAPEV